MPASFVQVSNVFGSGGGTLAAHNLAAAGDRQVLAIAAHTSVGITTPTGFTLVQRTNTAHSALAIFERTLAAGDLGASISLSWGDNGRAELRTYRGVDLFSVLGQGEGLTSPSRVVPTAGLILRFQASAQNNSSGGESHTLTLDAAMLNSLSPLSYIWYTGILGADDPTAPDGTAPARTATISGPRTQYPQWVDISLASFAPQSGNVAIPQSRVPTALSNFPVKIDLAKMPASFWTSVDSTLSNLRVRDGYGVDLPFDLVSCDSTAKTGQLYFRAASIFSTRDTLFQIAGVEGATPPAATDPLGRNAVWSDYDCVFIFDGNQGVDRAGKVPDLTLGAGVTIANGRLNFTGASGGKATTTGLPGRTQWTMALTAAKGNSSQATLFVYGASAKIVIDDGTTPGIYYDSWLYPSPNPAMVNGVEKRLHQTWDNNTNRKVYQGGGTLVGGGQAVDSTVTLMNGTDITLGMTPANAERYTGSMNRVYMRGAQLSDAWIAAEQRSWELGDLVVLSAPTAAPTITATEPGVSSITLRWAADPNASAYDVRIDGGTPVRIATTSYDFPGLLPNTPHTVEVRAANPLGEGPWASSSATTFDAIFYDTFNRADSTTSPGSPTHGGAYTVRAGTWGIASNNLRAVTSTAEAMLTFPGAIDFDATVKMTTPGPNSGLLFRWVDANNTWLCQMNTSEVIHLYRRVGGTWVSMRNLGRVTVAGDVVRIVAIGPRIWCYRNGVLVATIGDQFYSVATDIMGFRASTDTTARFDEITVRTPTAPSLSGDLVEEDISMAVRRTNAWLYKGRNRKSEDEGAVA